MLQLYLVPFDFNYYGFLIGIASIVSLLWWEKCLGWARVRLKNPNRDWAIVLVLAVFFARSWHVFTDWNLYQNDLWKAVAVWQGGLSILGALLGLVVGLKIVSLIEKVSFLKLLDILALSLPIGQAIGRFGNYFNQELYGIKTSLPWAIEISGEKHHPLFLYEVILLFSFAWFINHLTKRERIGDGHYFLWYAYFYMTVRFFLDFLRVQKTMFWSWLGLNQVIILVTLFFLSGLVIYKKNAKKD